MDPQWAFDPTRRYAYRWWDGMHWTPFVSDGHRSWAETTQRDPDRTAHAQAPRFRRGYRVRLSA